MDYLIDAIYMQNMLLDIHVFPHDAHRQPPHAAGQVDTPCAAAAARMHAPAQAGRSRAIPASMRSGPAAPSGKRVRPSYPDYGRRRVEDFAVRTRWMPSAVARYSFASCTPLSLNTGAHTTHNARRIFEAIIWRYVRSARFIKVRPPANDRLRAQNAVVYLGLSVRRFHPHR